MPVLSLPGRLDVSGRARSRAPRWPVADHFGPPSCVAAVSTRSQFGHAFGRSPCLFRPATATSALPAPSRACAARPGARPLPERCAGFCSPRLTASYQGHPAAYSPRIRPDFASRLSLAATHKHGRRGLTPAGRSLVRVESRAPSCAAPRPLWRLYEPSRRRRVPPIPPSRMCVSPAGETRNARPRDAGRAFTVVHGHSYEGAVRCRLDRHCGPRVADAVALRGPG
jgi:hypothetical protein